MATIAFTQKAINVNRATRVIFQFNNGKISKTPRLDPLSPHLVELHLSGNRLSDVPKLSLEKLQVLDLGNNNFAKLEDGVFTHLPNLQTLYLYNCRIVEISAGAFVGLENVETLQLVNNVTTTSLPEELFAPLKKLKNLNLSKMGLTQLSPSQFRGLSKLETLRLYLTKTTLPSEVFTDLQELRILDISEMGLTTLPHLGNNRKIEKLFASHNPIEELPAAMGLLQRLIRLEVRGNPLRKIDPSVLQIPALQFVDLGIYSSAEVHEQVRKVFPYRGKHLSDEAIEKVRSNVLLGASYQNEYHKKKETLPH